MAKKYVKCKKCGTKNPKGHWRNEDKMYKICTTCHKPICIYCGLPVIITKDKEGNEIVVRCVSGSHAAI